MPDDLLLFFSSIIKKMAVWKDTFVSERLNTDQSQLTGVLHPSYALPVAVLTIPAAVTAQPGQTM